jgi:hypothetical protein
MRWIADCPVHGEGVAEAVQPGVPFICSRCFPDIYATIPVQAPGGAVAQIPDVAMRRAARRRATEADQVYEVVFPTDKDEIEAQARVRPLENANWMPGMTVDDMRRENIEHGVGK